jgi:hypothetical protein
MMSTTCVGRVAVGAEESDVVEGRVDEGFTFTLLV